MDRPIEKQAWPPRRIAAFAAAGVGALALVYLVVANSGRSSLDVDSTRLTASQVRRGEFQEYVPINGVVQPRTTVYLDLEEGGIVEKVYVEGGNPIEKGDLILSFSNTAVQKQNIETETRLLENLDQLRNSKISLTQSALILKDQLLDLDHKIVDLEKTYIRYQQLMKTPQSQLSQEQFETTRNQVTYHKAKRELLQERIRQETILKEQQSSQIDSSIERVNRNLEILSRIIDSLEVRAPIDGHLSTLTAEVGQSFQRGQRIGQIDQLEAFKVRADIDQYYISKVAVGQKGRFDFDGRSYELELTKIYPEVANDVFQADLIFAGDVPASIKRGQSLQIDLSLSRSQTTMMVEKGSFYRHTKGRWAYLLAEDGQSAVRTPLVLGRQNPQFVEVLEGLREGDWIVNSSYERLDDVDELNFSEPVKR
jgi:HlyD family secretion protein